MKRIEFIAPVEAMRGNLSGAQKLQYPTDNQGAYEGPVGSVNYARNYSPRFVGSKRARDGRKYFSVRTKSANHLTAASKRAMALLGGVGAIVAAILRNKTGEPYVQAYAQWVELQNLGSNKTFRETLSGWIRSALVANSTTIPFTGPRSVYSIKNPWNDGTQTTGAEISQAILVKFWDELAQDGVTFALDGRTGIAKENIDFVALVGMSGMNILSLSLDGSDVIYNGSTVKLDGEDVAATYQIKGGEKFSI